MANGYANRFLWALVRRSKKIPNRRACQIQSSTR